MAKVIIKINFAEVLTDNPYQRMWKLEKYIYTVLIMACILCCSCKREVIIPKDKMSEIIKELYLADQYISVHHKYSAQRDSSKLFAAILNEYGYTADDYRRSTGYYLERKDSYKNILTAAKELLIEKQNILKERINRESYEQELLADTSRLTNHLILKAFVELKERFANPVSATDTIPTDTSTLWSIYLRATQPFCIMEELVQQKDSVNSNIAATGLADTANNADTAAIVKNRIRPNLTSPHIIRMEDREEAIVEEKEIR